MITIEIIKKVQGLGFDVWMKPGRDSWMYYTQGDEIGYLESIISGYYISTAHLSGCVMMRANDQP
jgi:hypothetical protein